MINKHSPLGVLLCNITSLCDMMLNTEENIEDLLLLVEMIEDYLIQHHKSTKKLNEKCKSR